MAGCRLATAMTATAVLLAPSASTTDWARITAPVELVLPRDHGAHPACRTEWWYLTGLVEDGEGNRYGVQVTFFRQGLDPSPPQPGDSALRARHVVAAHLALADVGDGRFEHAERLGRAAGGLAGFSSEDLRVWVGDWRLGRTAEGTLRVAARDSSRGLGVRLDLEPVRPLLAHGDRGLSRKGPSVGNASMYLSWTRLAATGSVELGGRSVPVRGELWFDHEWGTSQLGPGIAGWDWFSLRLDDGSDLMVYRLRRADGTPSPHSSGTFVAADGSRRRLGVDDASLTVTDRWTSPSSGAVYPAGWRLVVAPAGLDLRLRPLLSDAEVDGRASTGVIYWEGPIAVTGSHRGEGYAELTGYAGSLEGLF